MASNYESDNPPSPSQDDYRESDGEEDGGSPETNAVQQPKTNISSLLSRLQSSGALVKKPKQEFHCFTCVSDFDNQILLENHLLQHVSMPNVLLTRLSDDEMASDEEWSDEELEMDIKPKKLDISQILNKTGISIKKSGGQENALSAVAKLSGLTIKKNNSPIKEEKLEPDSKDLMQKLGQLGGIKLKLKSDGNNTNSFKVVNGLRNFKTSDDEDADDKPDTDDEGLDESFSDEELRKDDKKSNDADKTDHSEEETMPLPKVIPKAENVPALIKRPAVKQTPTRAVLQAKPVSEFKETKTPSPPPENVTIKKEVDETPSEQTGETPIFQGEIKTERSSPPPDIPIPVPMTAAVKTENEVINPPNVINEAPTIVPKQENNVTIIEINGDSNDEDDDCCVVSATPAEVKPIVPKTENNLLPAPPMNIPSSTLSSRLLAAPFTEKQHSFNWNAPDTKSHDHFEKSADDIFDSLLSKKESLSDINEYISLDKLGPQHTCDVCNVLFTSLSLLEEHKRTTGHCKTLVSPSALMPYPPSSSSLMSSLLPVKHLAEQVGKLTGMGGSSSSGFTHQQNVMINIQAYPGSGGMMVPGQPYNPYAPPNQQMGGMGNNMYGQPPQPMAGQQFPNSTYMGQQGFNQYQPPMSKPSYPGTMPTSPYSTAPTFASPTPLQSMQQTVYGQSGGIINPTDPQMSMMPPPSQPSPSTSLPMHFPPASSPGAMRPPASSGIRIQNVQTFPPGQLVNSGTPGVQIQSPRGPGPTAPPPRPRMPRAGTRATLRPGIQVQGQVRGIKPGPRMPLKRPGGPILGNSAPGQKRRPDMLLPGRHDNEDCHIMSMQKQREGMPMIQSVQGAKDKLNLGSQISITKKTVNKEANAMANVLASRGIMVKQKQKSRSPSPERPLPHIPNLGAGVSIKHTSKSSNFSIPEAKVGGGMHQCKLCRKMFMNQSSLSVHMSNAHPQSKLPVFKCDECPASYPKSLQLQHHKRVFHNVSGPDRELGLPVVDFSQEDSLKRLNDLGIYSFIPLANREQAGGCFGIPVISLYGAQNCVKNGLQALGADGLLSLGPLKVLPTT